MVTMMVTPVPESERTEVSPGPTQARLAAEAARIRADALASAQRLVEAARRSAEELHEQAVRQSEVMLRAARAEVARLTEEANGRQVAQTVQQVSWDAPGRVLEAANAEADRMRIEAQARADVIVHEGRIQAERDAALIVQAARDQAAQAQQQAAGELQAAVEELSHLQHLHGSRIERLDSARLRLLRGSGPAASEPVNARPNPPAQATSDAPAPVTPPAVAPTNGALPAFSRPPTMNGMAIAIPDATQAPITARLATAGQPAPSTHGTPLPAPPAAASAPTPFTPSGDVDLVLPGHTDRMTIEVMLAVLREQPGITVRAAVRRKEALVIPLVVDRPVPLISILQELPRVVAAVYSPVGSVVSTATGGNIVIELGNR
jgi:F0F1-type ATP synthase membrane subunit b/b'